MSEVVLPPEIVDAGELTDDAITGTFRVYQRARGHRYSLDDVLTAWVAACAKPDARSCLDLGTGIGSVLHMLAYALAHARFCAIEAQRVSFQLAERNVARNHLGERVVLLHGDLREVVRRPLPHAPFDLVTGTPPYVPPGSATPAPDAQKAYARQEFRGGVEAYLAAAAPVLAPGGRVVVCADARFPERVEHGALSVGLTVLSRVDALPRAGRPPLFSVCTLAHASERNVTACEVSSWVARDEHGARTEAYLDVRRFFGLPEATPDPRSEQS